MHFNISTEVFLSYKCMWKITITRGSVKLGLKAEKRSEKGKLSMNQLFYHGSLPQNHTVCEEAVSWEICLLRHYSQMHMNIL